MSLSPTCTQQWAPNCIKRESYKIKNSPIKNYYCYKNHVARKILKSQNCVLQKWSWVEN